MIICNGNSEVLSYTVHRVLLISMVSSSSECSAKGQVFLCKLGHQGCSSAQRQVFHRKFRNRGTGSSMRACHAAGPGSIPGRDKFPGWSFFRGFSSPVRQMSGSFRPPRSPNIIWPSLSSLIIHYWRHNDLRCWRALKTSYIHTNSGGEYVENSSTLAVSVPINCVLFL